MRKRAVFCHCWGGHPDYIWYPYAKVNLEELGFQVDIPALPDTDNPRLDQWLPALKNAVGEPNEDTILVGHSLGCA
ncbi:MAG: alpha/beta hydrolase, partial [Anaerolineales bacterium]|nr:alpha/beta hydrolase [Anaerolineales bacterium]